MYACVFSTKSLNQYFKQKGYGRDFWTYSGPVIVDYDSASRSIVLQNSFNPYVYLISSDGEISRFRKWEDGTYMIRSGETSMIWVSGSLAIQIPKQTVLRRLREEFALELDTNNKYFARMLRDNKSNVEYYIVYDRETFKEQFTGIGYVRFLETDSNKLVVIAVGSDRKTIRELLKTRLA